jgi:hypothetical protein
VLVVFYSNCSMLAGTWGNFDVIVRAVRNSNELWYRRRRRRPRRVKSVLREGGSASRMLFPSESTLVVKLAMYDMIGLTL